jgi:hypothetical protein
MRLCGARLITFFSFHDLRTIGKDRFADSGNDAGSVSKRRMENNMIKKLLGAAAMVAVAFAVVPAHAAGGCSGANLTKTESMVEAMADGDAKWAAQKHIAAAQDALLAGHMGACGMNLSMAMHAGMAK